MRGNLNRQITPFPRHKTMVRCCLEQRVLLVLPSWGRRRLCGWAEEGAASLDQLPWEERPSGLWPGKKVRGGAGQGGEKC